MGNIFKRMSIVFKAKFSKLLNRSEKLSETLEYGYEKQQELLQQVKMGLAEVVTAKKRLQSQSMKLEQQVVKLDTQARQAVTAGRDDLAKVALERKQLAQTELQSLDAQVQELQNQQDQLVEREQGMRRKIEAFRSKKEVIKAQYLAAEAQVMISEAASGVGKEMNNVGLAMQRAVEKTEDMQAKAEAMNELESSGVFEDVMQLGGGQSDIERELNGIVQKSDLDAELSLLKAELSPKKVVCDESSVEA